MLSVTRCYRSRKSFGDSRLNSSPHFLLTLPQNCSNYSSDDADDAASSQTQNKLLNSVFTGKCNSPMQLSSQTAEKLGKPVYGMLVSNGVQTEDYLGGEPACSCKQRVMISRGVQTDAVFVIGVSESVLHRSLLDTDGHLNHGQPSSPATSQVLQLSKYFPTVEDEDIRTDVAVRKGSSYVTDDDRYIIADTQNLVNRCDNQAADTLAQELSCHALACDENMKRLSRWETSVNLNGFNEGYFGAVAYNSYCDDDKMPKAVKCEDEDRDVVSIHDRSDQSGMSLAIEFSKAGLSVAMNAPEQSVISYSTTVRETSSKLVSEAFQKRSPLTAVMGQTKSMKQSAMPVLSPDRCADMATLTAAGENRLLMMPETDETPYASIEELSKEDWATVYRGSRIPPPPPSRPPVGSRSVISGNNSKASCLIPNSSARLPVADSFTVSGSTFVDVKAGDSQCQLPAIPLQNATSLEMQPSDVLQSYDDLPGFSTALTLTSGKPLTNVASPLPSGKILLVRATLPEESDAESLKGSSSGISSMSAKKRPSRSTVSATVRVSGARRQSRDVDRRSRPSAASRKSKGPRVSVGRKSLSKRRSVLQPEKGRSAKLSRPAAWLLNATKSTKRKVKKPSSSLSLCQLQYNTIVNAPHVTSESEAWDDDD